MIQHDVRLALAMMPVSLDPKYSVETKQLYAPLLKNAQAGVMATLDAAYGPHLRHRLDVYHVAGTEPSAIVIYVPGGGYTGGDKRTDNVLFGNIGSYFARRGMLGITMNYRLAPEVQWPAGAQDIALAVAWVIENAVRFGADGCRIVVFGHSAGASHCASFLFDPVIRGEQKVACGVLVSGGSYTPTAEDIEARANVRSYFGSDTNTLQRKSATSHVAGTRVPVLLAFAERDPGFLVTPTLEMAMALTRRDGRGPEIMRLAGHNHFSPPCSLSTSDDELGSAIVGFIKGIPSVRRP